MFGKRSSYTEPISLPVEVQCPCTTDFWIAVLFSIIAALYALGWIKSLITPGLVETKPLVAPLVIFFLVPVSAGIFRTAAARRRLGPGTLTVTRSGFQDTRLSDEPIPWSAFGDARLWIQGARTRRLSGVRLDVDPGAALPRLNQDYFQAFPPSTRTSIYLDFESFDRRHELADRIVGCVLSVQRRFEN